MRVFIAIDLPQEVKGKIFALAQKVTKDLNLKLVEQENLHITLAFLGEILEDRLGEVQTAMTAAKSVGKIKLSLGDLEPYPNKQKVFGIWIRLEGQKEKLFALYKRIVDGLLTRGFVLDNHLKFLPHITIGRMKGGGVPALEKVEKIEENFIAEKIALFVSELTPEGPRYIKICELELE